MTEPARSPSGAAPPAVRVVVADDHVAVRTGLVMILDSAPDITVVGEAADGLAAVEIVRSSHPDVVLMDVRMPGIDGIEATRRLRDLSEILVLTTFDLDDYVDEALAAGAAGFLLKSVEAPALLAAVRSVARGDGVLAPEVTRRLIDRLAAGGRRPVRPPGLDELTSRETDVLALLGQGLSNAEIAADLVITEATAKTHVSRVLAKLGLRSRAQAAVAARDAGLAG
ncbi:response regulator [Pseudonocardia sp.]|uniref:response regulator n=1 Tax=Pseudonocardia sp. TaxID=60912 RepID=UPI003D0C6892